MCDWITTFFNNLIKVDITGSTEYLLTIISITIAAFVIFLSLSVIPFQKISTEISGTLYKMFLKQKKFFLPVFVNLTICILQICYYPFSKDCLLVKFIYILSLIYVLISAFLYTKNIKEQLDISFTIYPLIEKDFNRTIKYLQKHEQKIKSNKLYQKKENEDLLSTAILYQINIEKFPLQLPVDYYDKIITYKIQNLYEILIDSLKKYQYGSYEKAIECLFSCIEKYFSYIDKHIVICDNVFLEFMEIMTKILDNTKSKSNSIYQNILINNLISLTNKLSSYTLIHDFYYSKIIDFFFQKVVSLTDDFVIGSNRIINLISLFNKTNENLYSSFETFYLYLDILQKSIYKTNNYLNKTMINKLINVFTYEVLTNKIYFLDNDKKRKILDLQNNIDANNVYAPLPGQGINDFTTSIEPNNDKTLSSVVQKTLSLYINELPDGNPLHYVSFLENIITILINRYHKGGTHINGIRDQLYCIYFNIFSLLDKNTFYYLYNTNIQFIPAKNEEKKLFNILLDILRFESNKPSFLGHHYFFSELKLLNILLSEKKQLLNHINQKRKYWIKLINTNKNLNYKIKISIYSYYKTLLPKDKKKPFLSRIKKLYKQNRPTKMFMPFVQTKYDGLVFESIYLNIPLPLKEFYKDYINSMIYNYLPYKKEKIKNEILNLAYPLDISQLLSKITKYNSIYTYGIILELIDESKLIIDVDNITLIKKPNLAGVAGGV